MAPGTSAPGSRQHRALSRTPDLETLRHSLAWLVVGNLAGVLLASLLVAPGLNHLLAPLTYGRWIPVHLDLQLYGWCAIPLVGLLFRLYAAPADPLAPRLRALALAAWSGALAIGAVCWLSGLTSGKIFLDWQGPDRLLYCLALAVLWITLLLLYRRRCRAGVPENRWPRLSRRFLLAGLAAVPAVMFLATSQAIYPPINPASGGPTGVSLLGSSLGLVAIFIYLPWLLDRPADDAHRSTRRLTAAYAAHLLVFALLSHGDATHRQPIQLLAIGSIAIWLPLLIGHFRRFAWPAAWRPWLLAFAGWSLFLVLSAVTTYLPGVLDHLKFTNALVAHSHAAMAGILSALNLLILLALAGDHPAAMALGSPAGFRLWQCGVAGYVLSLTLLGILEGADPGLLFRAADAPGLIYLLRLAAGLLMLAASLVWLRGVFAPVRAPEPAAAAAALEVQTS